MPNVEINFKSNATQALKPMADMLAQARKDAEALAVALNKVSRQGGIGGAAGVAAAGGGPPPQMPPIPAATAAAGGGQQLAFPFMANQPLPVPAPPTRNVTSPILQQFAAQQAAAQQSSLFDRIEALRSRVTAQITGSQYYKDARAFGKSAVKAIKSPLDQVASFGRRAMGLGAIATGVGVYNVVERENAREIALADISQRLGMPFASVNAMTTGGDLASRWGFNPQEATRALGQFTSIAGNRDPSAFHGAAALTRLFGLSDQQGMQFFGDATRQLGGSEHMQQKFAEMIAAAIKKGQLGGLQGEVLQSILTTNQSISSALGFSAEKSLASMTYMGAIMGEIGKKGGLGEEFPSLYGAGGMTQLGAMRQAGMAGSPFQLPAGMTTGLYEMAREAYNRGRPKGTPELGFMEAGNLLALGNTSDPRYYQLLGRMGEVIKQLPAEYQPQLLQRTGYPTDPKAAAGLSNLLVTLSDPTQTAAQKKKAMDDYQKAYNTDPAEKLRQVQAELAEKWAEIGRDLQPVYMHLQTAMINLTDEAIIPLTNWIVNYLNPALNTLFGPSTPPSGKDAPLPGSYAALHPGKGLVGDAVASMKNHPWLAGLAAFVPKPVGLAIYETALSVERTEALGMVGRHRSHKDIAARFGGDVADWAEHMARQEARGYEEMEKYEKAHPESRRYSWMMVPDPDTLEVTVTGIGPRGGRYVLVIPDGGKGKVTMNTIHPASSPRVPPTPKPKSTPSIPPWMPAAPVH